MISQPLRWRYLLLVSGTVVAAGVGYLGYELYPRFGLPPVEGLTLLLLATAAGVASFFAPCSFPLLVTLLARRPQDQDEPATSRRAPGPAKFGAALALGALVFLVMTGVGVAAGAGTLFGGVTFTSTPGRTLRVLVGVLLLVLGLVQTGVLADRPFRRVEQFAKTLNQTQARLRRRRPLLGFTVFGFFYLLAGFG